MCLYLVGLYSSPRSPVTSGSFFAKCSSWAVNICILIPSYCIQVDIERLLLKSYCQIASFLRSKKDKEVINSSTKCLISVKIANFTLHIIPLLLENVRLISDLQKHQLKHVNWLWLHLYRFYLFEKWDIFTAYPNRQFDHAVLYVLNIKPTLEIEKNKERSQNVRGKKETILSRKSAYPPFHEYPREVPPGSTPGLVCPVWILLQNFMTTVCLRGCQVILKYYQIKTSAVGSCNHKPRLCHRSPSPCNSLRLSWLRASWPTDMKFISVKLKSRVQIIILLLLQYKEKGLSVK